MHIAGQKLQKMSILFFLIEHLFGTCLNDHLLSLYISDHFLEKKHQLTTTSVGRLIYVLTVDRLATPPAIDLTYIQQNGT